MITVKDLDKPHFKITVQYVREPIDPATKTFSGPQNRPYEKIYEQRVDQIDLQRIIGAVNCPPDYQIQPPPVVRNISSEDFEKLKKGSIE